MSGATRRCPGLECCTFARDGLPANRLQTTTQAHTYCDSGVISMPAGFCRHVVGKTLINVFHCDSAETASLLAG